MKTGQKQAYFFHTHCLVPFKEQQNIIWLSHIIIKSKMEEINLEKIKRMWTILPESNSVQRNNKLKGVYTWDGAFQMP